MESEPAALIVLVSVLGAIIILFVIFVLPIWVIAHYWTKARRDRAAMTPEMERMMEDLWKMARDMDRRMETLETILDADAPGARTALQRERDALKLGEKV